MADYAQGARLVDLRRQRGLSREDAAHRIGVTAKTLYNWEMRNGTVRPANAKAVADFYGVAIDDVVTADSLQDYGEQLARIEAKLDALIDGLGGRLPGPPPGPLAVEDDSPTRGADRPGREKRT